LGSGIRKKVRKISVIIIGLIPHKHKIIQGSRKRKKKAMKKK
jgi:hypothetical protein